MNMMFNKHMQKTFVVLGVLFLFLGGVGVGYSQYIRGNTVSPQQVKAIIDGCVQIADSTQYVHCLHNSFFAIVRPSTVEAIITNIAQVSGDIGRQVPNGQSRVSCHEIGHIVGELASRTNGPLPLLVHGCGTTCGYGCIHGLMVGIAQTDPRTLTHPGGICVSTATYPMSQLDRNNCNHGLGHALIENASYDMNVALSQCRSLTDDEAYNTCSVGAFMGRFDGYNRTARPFEFPDDVIAYCSSFHAASNICIDTLAAMKYGGDIHGGFTLCARLGAHDASLCAIGIGTTLYFSEKGEGHSIAKICEKEKPFTRECIQGALESAINMDHSGVHGRAICDSLSQTHQTFCREFFGNTMQGWLSQ